MEKVIVIACLFLIVNNYPHASSEFTDGSQLLEYEYLLPNCFDTYDYPEVLYLPPEQVRNIIDFLNHFSTSTRPSKITSIQETTESITEEAITVTTHQNGITTLQAPGEVTTEEATTIPSTEFITRFFTGVEIKTPIIDENQERVNYPVEGVDNNELLQEKEETISVTHFASTTLPTEMGESTDSNNYDNEYERDSEEDILSLKKKAEKFVPTSPIPDDENNSKPKNVYNWLRF